MNGCTAGGADSPMLANESSRSVAMARSPAFMLVLFTRSMALNIGFGFTLNSRSHVVARLTVMAGADESAGVSAGALEVAEVAVSFASGSSVRSDAQDDKHSIREMARAASIRT